MTLYFVLHVARPRWRAVWFTFYLFSGTFGGGWQESDFIFECLLLVAAGRGEVCRVGCRLNDLHEIRRMDGLGVQAALIVGVRGLTFECAELSVWSASEGRKRTGETLPTGGCLH
jgi:hypothetical protein